MQCLNCVLVLLCLDRDLQQVFEDGECCTRSNLIRVNLLIIVFHYGITQYKT